MKNKWLRFAAAGAIAGGMLLAAQEVPSQPAQQPPVRHSRQQRAARLAQYLNLTPEQQAQAQADMQALHQQMQPIRQQLKQVHANLMQAIRANDTAHIDQFSAHAANLKGQMSAMRNESRARFYAGLSPDQKAKADQLPALMRQMRQRRMQNNQNPNNG